jgi:hypothetical protein
MKDLEITLDKNLLNNRDLDFFHYMQSYELAKCKYGKFYLVSRGELKCHYVDEKNNVDTWNYSDIVNYYITNNDELGKAIDEDKIYFDMNNWFSIEMIDNNGNYVEIFDYLDNVYGSIREGLNSFEELMKNKEFIDDILGELRVTND